MGQPTITRQDLRRAICRQLQMPFFKYFESSTFTSHYLQQDVIDSKLVQQAGSFTGHWLYCVDGLDGSDSDNTDSQVSGNNTGEIKKISYFADSTLRLSHELPGPILPGDEYEIHSWWNALDLHSAINRALLSSFPAFFEVVTDESICLSENNLEYSLSSLDRSPHRILKIWIERNTSGMNFECVDNTGSATTYLEVKAPTDVDLTDVDTNWMIGVYSGSGAKQVEPVASVAGQTIRMAGTIGWSITPTAGDKIRIWDASMQTIPWYRLPAAIFDQPEFPTKFWLSQLYPSMYGLRFRIQYTARPIALEAEADETAVPQEYVIYRALSILYSERVALTSADRQKYASLTKDFFDLAEDYKRINAWGLPEGTAWSRHDAYAEGSSVSSDDPLGYRD